MEATINQVTHCIAWIPAAVAGVSAIASWISNKKNRKSQEQTNQRSEDYSREMFNQQNERDKEFWRMQNAYNDPAAQMERFKNAGLSPHLIYGQGNEAGPIATSSAPTPKFEAPQHADSGQILNNSMFQYVNLQQQQANIARTQAETESIRANTQGKEFDNAVKQMVGVDAHGNQILDRMDITKSEMEIARLNQSKQLAEYNAWSSGSFQGRETDDPNSPIAKAIKAGYDSTLQELENAKSLGSLRQAEIAIKRFEANLAKQGISPNSPWFVKILGDLIGKFTGQSIFQTITAPD